MSAGPENVVLHHVNFSVSQHATERPSQARIRRAAVRHSLHGLQLFVGKLQLPAPYFLNPRRR